MRTIRVKVCIRILLIFFFSLGVRAGDELRLKAPASLPTYLQMGIPGAPDLIIARDGFAVGYSYRRRQALWVCYILTAEQLAMKQVKRSNRFRADPLVEDRPVQPGEYDRSGFDRGHLAPASDMTYSQRTMEDSFFMTNISPQIPACNRGIWKRIEAQARAWAMQEKRLFVITGPIFDDNGTMGDTGISVPKAFYKVLLDMTPPYKMIAFIVPNRRTKRPIRAFVATVDEVESTTGLNFFSNLEDSLEAILEQKAEIGDWGVPLKPETPRKRRTPVRSAAPSPSEQKKESANPPHQPQ